MPVPTIVQFWLSIVFIVPSILCALFSLSHLLLNRTLRTALNNHVVIIIIFLDLIYNLTAAVWFADYYRTGVTMLLTPSFCVAWAYSSYAVFAANLYVVAWASIERHVLIFHQNLVATRTKRIMFHYLPLFIATMYPFVYYIIIFFARPCQSTPVATVSMCGVDYCAYDDTGIGLWDGIANNIAPVFVIVIFSLTLLGRVWYSKCRINQRMRWRNYRKLAAPLLSISALYLLFLCPVMVLFTAYTVGLSTSVAADFYSTAVYMGVFAIYFTPFVSMCSSSELREKLQRISVVCRARERLIHPFAIGKTGLDARKPITAPKRQTIR